MYNDSWTSYQHCRKGRLIKLAIKNKDVKHNYFLDDLFKCDRWLGHTLIFGKPTSACSTLTIVM